MADEGGSQQEVTGNETEATRQALLLYYQPVYRYCYLMLYRQPDEAKDATQEVFARAYQGIQRLRQRTAERAWLFGIAHHVCLEIRRSQSKRQGPYARFRVPQEPATQPLAAASLDLRRLQEGLSALPLPLRSPVLLRFGLGIDEELSLEEIAQALSVSRATVHRRIQQALTALRRRLDVC